MKMADRFKLPIISIIDTPGAFPGIGAEEGMSEAIAVNLREMASLGVPVIALVIGRRRLWWRRLESQWRIES